MQRLNIGRDGEINRGCRCVYHTAVWFMATFIQQMTSTSHKGHIQINSDVQCVCVFPYWH